VLYYLQGTHHQEAAVTTTAQGYGVEATLTDDALRLRATTKMGRIALLGPDGQDGTDAVTVPLGEITYAKHFAPPKWALGTANGRLDIRTAGGKRYQLHYRVKKNRDFRAFADAVVAAVTPVPSA
jgi:hypothetical protein